MKPPWTIEMHPWCHSIWRGGDKERWPFWMIEMQFKAYLEKANRGQQGYFILFFFRKLHSYLNVCPSRPDASVLYHTIPSTPHSSSLCFIILYSSGHIFNQHMVPLLFTGSSPFRIAKRLKRVSMDIRGASWQIWVMNGAVV